ncbi:MAG: hypothetical protein ACHQAY_20495, partial [Hyphomicrobiales bacterium]
MAYASDEKDFARYAGGKSAAPRQAGERMVRILRRMFGTVFESRQKQDDREIAGFLARSGGRLTDD